MFDIVGKAIDWTEKIAREVDDPETRAAGAGDPHYLVSEQVSVSQDRGLYVYHLRDDQLGQGASLGNQHAWAETKGNNDMLGLFSIEAGVRMLGGMSVTYQLPFSDLSITGRPASHRDQSQPASLARVMPSGIGHMHLHPAYQQREFIIGDGLHILETFFLPRTGDDDPSAACKTVSLKNDTPHPIEIIVVACVDFRGHTSPRMKASFHDEHGVLLAHNVDKPEWGRFFGADREPQHYWATTDEEEAYSPDQPLPDEVTEEGELLGALQFDLILMPGQQRKVRFFAGFSLEGEKGALKTFRQARDHKESLSHTIDHYSHILETAALQMPDDLLTQGAQWSKANMLRPLAQYPIGLHFTNDPGDSSHFVGRDTAWYTQGCDFVMPEACCQLLRVFSDRQREDGLIVEWIDGMSGETEDHNFNINDNTPLFVLAVAHHIKATHHEGCLKSLYEPARKAAELILSQRDERGLVCCTADGRGAKGICGWRNIIEHAQINGAVTELNAQCCGALKQMAELAEIAGHTEDAQRYMQAHEQLVASMNEHLVDPRTNLYIRNIDLEGRVFSQATVDLVFPLLYHVADRKRAEAITSRLFAPDFMTSGGLRVLPEENPRYDPSENSGCLGGVWPGATWWFAMGCTHSHPSIMADSLRRSFHYQVRDPKTFNTVPGQFNEWSDGQTLVNRGMRLSPWGPPRYFWAAVEGIAGVTLEKDGINVSPHIPPEWSWLRLHDLPYGEEKLSFFITREQGELQLYTPHDLRSELTIHRYDQEITKPIETLTTSVTSTALMRDGEVFIFLGSSRDETLMIPVLTHHALSSGTTYKVSRLNSLEADWRDLGEIKGSRLQRMATRIEPHGFCLYRFQF